MAGAALARRREVSPHKCSVEARFRSRQMRPGPPPRNRALSRRLFCPAPIRRRLPRRPHVVERCESLRQHCPASDRQRGSRGRCSSQSAIVRQLLPIDRVPSAAELARRPPRRRVLHPANADAASSQASQVRRDRCDAAIVETTCPDNDREPDSRAQELRRFISVQLDRRCKPICRSDRCEFRSADAHSRIRRLGRTFGRLRSTICRAMSTSTQRLLPRIEIEPDRVRAGIDRGQRICRRL